MRVIVNVDDVGLHPAVQRAVEVCAEAGVVTSTSVLANGPCVRDARRLRGIGMAAHLNLLRGVPLSPREEVATLVRADGLLICDYAKLYARYALRQLDLAEVELEWDRQIVSLLELGLPLTHLDSEKHIHCWPRLMPIACRLAERHGLGWVRRSIEPYSAWNWGFGGCRARLLSSWGKSHQPHPTVAFPDSIWGLAAQGDLLTPNRFRRDLPTFRDCGILEISCHPGFLKPGDGPLPDSFGRLRVADLWHTEFESLRDLAWRELFAEFAIELTHYGLLDPTSRESIDPVTSFNLQHIAA